MKRGELTTHIIAGIHKGKKIKLPSSATTRPSKSILKESFFNTLQNDIVDAIFIEVFAGSGSMGLEALSRGASRVYFIERDRAAFSVLKKNISLFNSASCFAFNGDSFHEFPNIIKAFGDEMRRVFLYYDPPFSIRDGMDDIYEKVMKSIRDIPLQLNCMAVIEHMSELKMPTSIGHFNLKKTKKFGKSSLSYYVKQKNGD